MDDEKLLPVGEPTPPATPVVEPVQMPHEMYVRRKRSDSPLHQFVSRTGPAYEIPTVPVEEKKQETVIPVTPAPLPGVPSSTQQSWGTLVSIVVIVLMIIVGAFYAWGNRIAQNQQIAPAAVQ